VFERYNERARRALFFARYEASELGSRTIEPFHLLLGLVRAPRGATFELLVAVADPLEELVNEIHAHIITGPKFATSIEIPFSPAAKRALELAAEEADGLSHDYIGTKHLALGILRGEDSVAAAILFGRGLRVEKVRERIA
jgi:ATP-dependent Clp protease ATP-binding subunit ClpC